MKCFLKHPVRLDHILLEWPLNLSNYMKVGMRLLCRSELTNNKTGRTHEFYIYFLLKKYFNLKPNDIKTCLLQFLLFLFEIRLKS